MPKIVRKIGGPNGICAWWIDSGGLVRLWYEPHQIAADRAAALGLTRLVSEQVAVACNTTLAEIRRELEEG